MSDDETAPVFGPRPELPPRPPVPDDRIHGDTLHANVERPWPGSQDPAAAPVPETLGPPARRPAGRHAVADIAALPFLGGAAQPTSFGRARRRCRG